MCVCVCVCACLLPIAASQLQRSRTILSFPSFDATCKGERSEIMGGVGVAGVFIAYIYIYNMCMYLLTPSLKFLRFLKSGGSRGLLFFLTFSKLGLRTSRIIFASSSRP